jgi:hypothetical protein
LSCHELQNLNSSLSPTGPLRKTKLVLLNSHFPPRVFFWPSFALTEPLLFRFIRKVPSNGSRFLWGNGSISFFLTCLKMFTHFFNIVKYIRWDGLNLHANEIGFTTQTFHSNAHFCVWDNFCWYTQNVLQTVSLKTKYNQGHGCLEPQPKNHKF